FIASSRRTATAYFACCSVGKTINGRSSPPGSSATNMNPLLFGIRSCGLIAYVTMRHLCALSPVPDGRPAAGISRANPDPGTLNAARVANSPCVAFFPEELFARRFRGAEPADPLGDFRESLLRGF